MTFKGNPFRLAASLASGDGELAGGRIALDRDRMWPSGSLLNTVSVADLGPKLVGAKRMGNGREAPSPGSQRERQNLRDEELARGRRDARDQEGTVAAVVQEQRPNHEGADADLAEVAGVRDRQVQPRRRTPGFCAVQHDGQTKEANHNLKCGHPMAVKSVRVVLSQLVERGPLRVRSRPTRNMADKEPCLRIALDNRRASPHEPHLRRQEQNIRPAHTRFFNAIVCYPSTEGHQTKQHHGEPGGGSV